MEPNYVAALDQMCSTTDTVRGQLADLYGYESGAARQAALLAVIIQSGSVRDEAARLFQVEMDGPPPDGDRRWST